MDNIIVKKIKSEDISRDFIDRLHIAFPVTEENPSWNLKQTRNFISNKANLLLIGFMKGNMAGYLYGHTLDRFDNDKEFFVYGLYTSKAYRREGVMRAIIDKLQKYLKTNNFKAAWVLTNKSNKPAMSLYMNTGGSIPNGDDLMFEYRLGS